MNDQPWYKNGLRFRCTQCGSCCTGAPGFVWVNKAEIAALAAAIRLDIEEFQRRYVRKVGIRNSLIEMANGDCVFFHQESRSCQVYEQRPGSAALGRFGARTLSIQPPGSGCASIARGGIVGRSRRCRPSRPGST